jgi:hypothetical protein
MINSGEKMDKFVVKIRRIEAGAMLSMPFVVGGRYAGKAPVDGFVISTNEMDTSIFIRDSDIEEAKRAYEDKGRSSVIIAKSVGA